MERIFAPIDNKNLMEDPIVDDVFRDFYWAPDHRRGKSRHLVGTVRTDNYDTLVEAKWRFGDAAIEITIIGMQPSEDYECVRDEVFAHYERIFKSWQCEDNEGLIVETSRWLGFILRVSFYFECD